MTPFRVALCVLIAFSSIGVCPAVAQFRDWNAQHGTWSDPTKWNPALVPGLTEIARIGNLPQANGADVELDGGVKLEPGDKVLIHGEEIEVPYGEKATFRRMATVTRAGALERAWTRATGDFEFMELCEFSFSSGRKL